MICNSKKISILCSKFINTNKGSVQKYASKNDVKKCGRLKNGHLMAIVSTDWLMLRCHCVCECECDVGLE